MSNEVDAWKNIQKMEKGLLRVQGTAKSPSPNTVALLATLASLAVLPLPSLFSPSV